MKQKSTVLLSTILFVVFVLSVVATMYTTADAGFPRMWTCCTKVLADGTVINGIMRPGMPVEACSYTKCVEYADAHMCTCSKTK